MRRKLTIFVSHSFFVKLIIFEYKFIEDQFSAIFNNILLIIMKIAK